MSFEAQSFEFGGGLLLFPVFQASNLNVVGILLNALNPNSKPEHLNPEPWALHSNPHTADTKNMHDLERLEHHHS